MTNDNSARLAALRQEAINRASYPPPRVCKRTEFEVHIEDGIWCKQCNYPAGSHDY